MSGREALKGFGFQTDVMLLCFLEHCIQETDFYMVGEPAKSLEVGDFVDIELFINNNGKQSKKIIQVKKSITTTKAREVISELMRHHVASDDHIELWFTEYVLQNKMALLDSYDNLKEAIDIPAFAQSEIRGSFGDQEMIIRIDGSIPNYSFVGTTLQLRGPEILDNDTYKIQIEDKVAAEYKENKKYVISKIKQYLDETLIYRRHKFLDQLDLTPNIREEILKRDYNFFKKVVIRQIGEAELVLRIKDLIPSKFSPSQKELLQGVLFSFFYRKSSTSDKIEKNEVDALISNVAEEIGYPNHIVDWSCKSSIYHNNTPSLVPTASSGNFRMGGTT
jgi:hypothetical protein